MLERIEKQQQKAQRDTWITRGIVLGVGAISIVANVWLALA